MRFLRDAPIKQKLTLIIMLTTSLALLLASTAFIIAEVLSFRYSMARNLSAMADIVGANSAAALVFKDQLAAKETLEALSAVKAIVSAGVYAKDGTLFAKYLRGDVPKDVSVPARPENGRRFEAGHFVLFHPIIYDGKKIGTVYLQSDMGEMDARLKLYAGIVALVLLASAFAAFLLSAILQRAISDPILHLADTMHVVSRDKTYSVRAVTSGRDELGALIDGFNDMLAQIQEREAALQQARDELERRVDERTKELQQQIAERARLEQDLLQAQKMEAIGRLAGGIAHDFNNLLQAILGNIDLTAESLPKYDPVGKYLQTAKQAGLRAADLTRYLLAFSRRTISVAQPLDLRDIVSEVAQLLRRTIDPRIVIETHVPPELWPVQADPSQMHQVLMNLCVNARDAMPEGGRLTIALENRTRDGAEFVRLTVSDTGTGMDAETRRRIFEPFFTTKEVGKGTGLGLAMVYGVVTQHEGTLAVDSEPGRGTRFVIELPRSTQAPEAVSAPTPARRPDSEKGAGETVLVVDDDEMVRQFARAILTQAGYVVLEAEDGARAVSIYSQERSRIAAVLLDLMMPNRSGLEVLADLRRIDPAVRVILCSGYSAEGQGLDLARLGAKEFLQKPYAPTAMVRAIRQVLDQAG
jgi:signal transduction histidine kinase/ActR/RegA family two-component response regulator